MKKLISILVIVAMLLASVLAMIPASAAKVSDTALATYNVNWANLASTMESRWVFSVKTNYTDLYEVHASENQLYAEAKGVIEWNEEYSYYSKTMFDITESTYYEYDLKIKNNPDRPSGSAGVVVAFGRDDDAHIEDGDGDYQEGPYFLYGEFGNVSDESKSTGRPCAELSMNFGHQNKEYAITGGSTIASAKAVKEVDGFVNYKIVYDGLVVRVYYEAEDGTYEKFFANDMTLPEGAKVAFGIYSREEDRFVIIKNCSIKAYNDESAVIIAKGNLAAVIDAALAKVASDKYVAATENALTTAVEDAEDVLNNTEADATAIADAIAAIEGVTLTVKATVDDKAALQASLTTANTLTEQPATATNDEWDDFVAARTAAQNAYDNAEASKADVAAAKAALDDAYALATAAADTTALADAIAAAKEKVEAGYTKASWDVFAAKLAAAEGLDANADQAAVDTAKTDLENAMNALVPVAANLGDLKTAYDKANAITEKPSTATDAAWTAFTDARDAANALLTARSGDTDAVASATTTLNEAQRLLDPRINVMGDSNKTEQFAGNGNVFYYDYHRYIAAKNWDGVSAFPNISDAGNAGTKEYMLRFERHDGSGSASACDGNKESSDFTHHVGDPYSTNGKTYKHAFGYSFKERVTVDSVKFYLPTTTEITSIDVYGAVLSENNGTVVYGKDADKVFLGKFDVVPAEAGAAYILVEGDLSEAYSVDYIFFAVSGPSGTYKFYEIELYGVLNGADYSALKAAIATAKEKVQTDYTTDTWNAFAEALTAANAVNKSSLSTQADINSIVGTLNDAMAALAANPVDKTALAASIAAAEALKQADYVSTSWTTLAAPLAAAKAANESTEATQSDVNAAKAALDAAVAALVKRGDKTELKALIEEYKALKETDWNGNTTAWGMFLKGIEAAEALCENADASEADVAGMITDLKDRKAALKAPENNGGAEGDEPTADPETPGTDAPVGDETDAPETDAPVGDETDAPAGDETEAKKGGCGSSIALSALAVIGVVGTALVIKKKED